MLPAAEQIIRVAEHIRFGIEAISNTNSIISVANVIDKNEAKICIK